MIKEPFLDKVATHIRRIRTVLLALILLLPMRIIHADVGGDNPTGTSGQFNSNLEVGVDPLTMNATRSVTDLVIAGGTGSYPLAFTRTMNSRYTAGAGNTPAFGTAGTWTHSYQWSIDPVTVASGLPTTYNVNYPDGRRISFQHRTLPTGENDPDYRGPLGVRDRFEKLTTGATECYVRLPDGGKVWFHATITTGGGNTTYTFSLKGIIDPYGQQTLVTTSGNTTTVTEPAGRTLQIITRNATSAEGNTSDIVVDHIVGSDGRTVYYYYTAYITANQTRYTSLTSVRYFGDATWDATYTYQAGNIDPNGRPLIASGTDPMFDGSLWKVAYDFKPAGTNADGSAVVYGQIWRVKNWEGTIVSTLTVNAPTSTGPSRTETRGDGPSRTFVYKTYRLKTATDFKGVVASQDYDNDFYLQAVTDRNGNITNVRVDNALTGNIGLITYPIPGDVSPSGKATQVNNIYYNSQDACGCNQDNNNRYWLGFVKDGNGTNIDAYFRNPNRTLSYVIYYDGTTDVYTYNSFNQILTHRNRRAYTETYGYDPAVPSRVSAYWDAAHPTSGTPTARYQYDSYGRVSGITDANNYTTTFQYNARGQLTRLTHPDGTYIQYSYNPNGTLAWTADENHPGASTDANQQTSYTYDDYKRLLSVTTPLRAIGDTTSRVTSYNYDPSGNGGTGYTRTAALPTKVTSPGGKVVNIVYDENLRTTSVTAVGDANVPNATTSYTYDANGNVLTVKDPNGQVTGAVTTYYYDAMNRVSHIDDAITTDRNSNGHTVDYTYDVGGHVVQENRVDDKTASYTYDAMGRLTQKTGFAGEITTYRYDYNGNLTSMIVPVSSGTRVYSYQYDQLDRKTSATYPYPNSYTTSSESYQYDIANRLWKYTNPAGQTKTLTYDNRGRLTDSSWDSNGPTVHIAYDPTRPTSITTSDGTTIAFGYDDANNRIYEDQTITINGLPVTRRVQTDPDADGSRKNLVVKTGSTTNFENHFNYTSRNELLNIKNGSDVSLFTYSYDASGNVTQRVNQAFANAADKVTLQYDAMNRPTLCAQYAPGNSLPFATSHYDYTKRGNLNYVYRDEESKGDYFNNYDDLNQLNAVKYSATSASDANPAKYVTYTLGPSARTSMTVTDNTLHTTTTTNYTANDLNQFTSIQVVGGTTQSPGYDTNFNLLGYNGLTYTYDAESRLTQIAGNSHSASFVYDGVGRCVKRVIDGVTTIFSYDQWTPVAEWDGSGNLLATNVYGLGDDEILSRTAGSTQLFYKNDPMGNVMFLMNSAGTGVEKYKYDAFGAPTITDWNGANSRNYSNFGNRFMFSGRDYLKDFGIYDMRNRAYDPSTGHFHQTDPIGFGGDAYSLLRFSGNNPLLGGDPSGLNPWDISGSDDSSSSDSGWFSSDSPTTLEFGVYNGAGYAYGSGYGYSASDEARMNAIFGPPSDSGTSSWESDSSFAGGLPSFSGTAFFGGVLTQPKHTLPSFGARLISAIRVPVEFMIGENWGAAYRDMFMYMPKDSKTGPPVPANVASAIDMAFAASPPDAYRNGYHAWHAGSNARLTQMFGVVAAPVILLGGVFHETLSDPSYIGEIERQGIVNARLDSMGDIVANSLGIAIGTFDRSPNGVTRAIQLGNRIPGPIDPQLQGGRRYTGNPLAAWRK
jgi:RHS repeat-associated protein